MADGDRLCAGNDDSNVEYEYDDACVENNDNCDEVRMRICLELIDQSTN